jgi:hypothetical protein
MYLTIETCEHADREGAYLQEESKGSVLDVASNWSGLRWGNLLQESGQINN